MQLKASDFYRISLSALLGRPSNFSFFDEFLYASGIPYGRRAVEWIKEKGINSVINLTEYELDYDGLEKTHIPMKNGEPQKPEVLHKAVKAIEKYQKNKMATLVHCSAGLGRTGMVLSCYLIYKYNMKAKDALIKLRELRKGSVADKIQEQCVYFYENWLKNNVRGADNDEK
ncbi:MAG: dual specificity protein phosphatase family protein [Nitrososphaeria archaeon]|nr:dual specificity protein phosphatase family protein [Conexivisphaerales archaeon]